MASQPSRPSGFTAWFTGVCGVGKSTLAAALALALPNTTVEVIDADDFRKNVSAELGFSAADRVTNIRCIGYVSRLLAKHGVAVIVAAIAPHREVREEIRRSHSTPFIEIFLECELEERIRRDSKGLYARALRGEIKELTGLTGSYEPPPSPDLQIRTDTTTIQEAVDMVLRLLAHKQLIATSPADVHRDATEGRRHVPHNQRRRLPRKG
jgi:adenylylsulfate kinase